MKKKTPKSTKSNDGYLMILSFLSIGNSIKVK